MQRFQRKEHVISAMNLVIGREIASITWMIRRKKKGSKTTASSIYVIDINLSISTSISQVSDFGCGSHICVNMQSLKRSRMLKKCEVDIRVKNEANVLSF